MLRFFGVALALSLLSCLACSRWEYDQLASQAVTDANYDSGGATRGARMGAANPIKLKIDTSGMFSRKSDSFDIESLSLQGDLLKLVVSFGGGCQAHTFDVWTDNSLSLDQPPVIKLFISHDANGDRCEALLQQELLIDLSPIKAAFLKANPGQASGVVSVMVDNNGATVQYEFGP